MKIRISFINRLTLFGTWLQGSGFQFIVSGQQKNSKNYEREDNPVKALITSAARNSGMAITRELSEAGFDVIGVDDRFLPFKIHSRYSTKQYICPNPAEDHFMDRILDIIKIEKPDVFIPVSGMMKCSIHKKELLKHTHILVPEHNSFVKAIDSELAFRECKKLRIACPEIYSEQEAIRELQKNKTRKVPLRLVVKPKFDGGASRGLSYVEDVESYRIAKEKSKRVFGDYTIQEFIPGSSQSMRTVNMVFGKDGELVAHMITKKLRTWPASGGIAALSISSDERELLDYILPFFKKWRWEGLAEAEIKIDARDNKPKLIEINPRFWGYIGFSIQAGINFPVIAARLALGEDLSSEKFSYPIGLKYINNLPFLKSTFAALSSSDQKMKMSAKIYREWEGRKVTNHKDWRDYKAFVAKTLYELNPSHKISDI